MTTTYIATTMKQASAGAGYTLILLNDGKVVSMGKNADGERLLHFFSVAITYIYVENV